MNPIVGIGELLWDVYPDGRKVAGGAPFNFAFHCHQLGHPAVIVSRVGDDELGRELRERVRELGLSDEYIQTDRDHPTGTVQVSLDANAVPTYAITEAVAWDYIAWEEKLEALSGRYEAVCFGTLASRIERKSEQDSIARFVCVPSRVHPRPLVVADLNLRPPFVNEDAVMRAYTRSHWLKMSVEEMRAEWPKLMPVPGREEFNARNWFERLNWEQWGPASDQVFIATDGPNGVTVLHCDEEFHEPGMPARVVDTVGAGDAFTAAMVCLHLEGRPLRECARFANHYAARVCEQPGGTPRIDRADVERQAFGRRSS
jgi:fructokinase